MDERRISLSVPKRRDSPKKRNRRRKPFCMYSMYFYSDTVSVPLCKRRTPSKRLQIDVTKKVSNIFTADCFSFHGPPLLPSSSTVRTTAFVPPPFPFSPRAIRGFAPQRRKGWAQRRGRRRDEMEWDEGGREGGEISLFPGYIFFFLALLRKTP